MREQALGFLAEIALQLELSKIHVQHPVFRTFPGWLSPKEMETLPIQLQCELIEYKEGTFTCFKALVIDVESIEVFTETFAVVRRTKNG